MDIFSLEAHDRLARRRVIEKLERLVTRRSYPRLVMFVVVAFTGLAGFVTSVVLLHGGLREMWLRYGVSVAVAYGVFLLLLRYWVGRRREVADFELDLPDFDLPDFTSSPRFDAPSDSGWDFPFDFGLDLDDAVVLIAFVAAVGVAVAASFYVIFIAPSLFAELMFDGVLSAALYGRLQKHWLRTAVARTRTPVLCVISFFVLAGFVAQTYAPEARSVGGVVHHYCVKHHAKVAGSLPGLQAKC